MFEFCWRHLESEMVGDGSGLVGCIQLFLGIGESVVAFHCIYTAASLFLKLVRGYRMIDVLQELSYSGFWGIGNSFRIRVQGSRRQTCAQAHFSLDIPVDSQFCR